MSEITHKLVFHKSGAATSCKLDVIALYPMTWHALSSEAGAERFKVSMIDKHVTCEQCKKRMNGNGPTNE